MGTLLSETTFALRALVRRPAYALLAMVTLALGIGASTAIFSAFHRLVVEPLPYPDADRLTYVMFTDPSGMMMTGPRREVSAAWLEQSRSFSGLARYTQVEMSLTGEGQAVVLDGTRASATLPEVLGMDVLIGRTFTVEEADADAKVVVLSEQLWRSRFGASVSVLGRTMRLQGQPYTIIGVMPAEFGAYSGTFGGSDFWTPLKATDDDYSLNVMGRLADGVTPDKAAEELQRLANGVAGAAPRPGWEHRVLFVQDLIDPTTRKALPILLGAVGLVLLIACANVAGLLMVRLTGRAQELGIRAALGASRRRLLSIIGIEQGIVVLGAGVLGLLLAAWSMSAIRAYRPARIPLLDAISLDAMVLLFASALVVVTTLVFTAIPAVHIIRRGAQHSAGSRHTQRNRGRAVLVAGEIALSVVLVVGAALLLRSFINLQSTELGFETRGRFVVDLAVPQERYADADQRSVLFGSVMEGLNAIPGVERVAVAGAAPPRLGVIFGDIEIEGKPDAAVDVSYISGTAIGANFLDALGARVIDGRPFREDDADTDHVVVNRAFAERFWPGESAVEKRFRMGAGSPAIIVGVFDDLAVNGPIQAHSQLQMFLPLDWSWPHQTIVVQADVADEAQFRAAVRQVVARVDPDLPVREIEALSTSMGRTIDRQRFVMGLLISFAVLALILSSVGLYGLVSFSLEQRVREMGVRMALGATPGSVYSLFIREGAALTFIGIAGGLTAAFLAARVLTGLLHGVTPYDFVSFAGAVACITVTALAACLLPARRATRVDPAVTLRSD